MAYIIGKITEEEQRRLEARGWEFEPAPAELVPDDLEGHESERMKMVFVDSSMFDIMTGPDWERGAA